MKCVFRSQFLADVAHWRNMLELRGIGCHIRNFHLGGALGDLPFLEVMPELWVLDDRDAELAQRVIAGAHQAADKGEPPWRCAACTESIEAQFTACWRCGAERAAEGVF